MDTAKNIDEYILGFPPEIQEILQQVRKTIHQAAPEATEAISWGMPTFKLKGNLIHFAGHTKHIGLYPGAAGIEAFKEKFSGYKFSKGAVQFPFDKPMPLDLITEIVKFRVKAAG